MSKADCGITNFQDMRRTLTLLHTLIFIVVLSSGRVDAQASRAPAYPLITHDPYLSVWSATDEIYASTTRHWTGSDQSIAGFIKVDGKVYRILGSPERTYESMLPAADETTYEVAYTETNPSEGWNPRSEAKTPRD